VSRLCDRVTRRAPPGLDSDLSGLRLSFVYPGIVSFSGNTLPISSILAFSTRQIHLSSVTRNARNSVGSRKLFGVRQTIAPVATHDLRTKSRFAVSPTSGSSLVSESLLSQSARTVLEVE
jgi:hypothetical protein